MKGTDQIRVESRGGAWPVGGRWLFRPLSPRAAGRLPWVRFLPPLSEPGGPISGTGLKLAWFTGVDWGSQKHQACVLDAAGNVLGEREFEHGGAGLSQMADWLLSFAAGDEGEVGVAIETPRGPVVESLMERGFAVHSINPKQLDRFRDRMSPAGAKDDRRDARVLASALRTDPHCLRRLEPTDPAIIELREWSRLDEDLTRERVRLANRMRQQLWRYYPQFLDAVDDDVAAQWALDLWRSLPTPRAGQRVREVTLTRVLKQHRIRRIDAATLRAPGCARRPSSWRRARPKLPLRMCGSSPNASPWSTARAITRVANSTGWCISSPRLLRRTTRTRRRRTTRRRQIRRMRPSCCRCPASAPRCSPRCWPRAATRCGGGTTTHFAVSAAWLRSPAVRARA